MFHDSSSDEKVIGDGWNETVWVGVERLECEIHWSDTVSSPQLVYELLQSIETYHTRGCHRSLKSLPRQMQRLSIGSGQQVPMRPILDQYIPSLVEGQYEYLNDESNILPKNTPDPYGTYLSRVN